MSIPAVLNRYDLFYERETNNTYFFLGDEKGRYCFQQTPNIVNSKLTRYPKFKIDPSFFDKLEQIASTKPNVYEDLIYSIQFNEVLRYLEPDENKHAAVIFMVQPIDGERGCATYLFDNIRSVDHLRRRKLVEVGAWVAINL